MGDLFCKKAKIRSRLQRKMETPVSLQDQFEKYINEIIFVLIYQ